MAKGKDDKGGKDKKGKKVKQGGKAVKGQEVQQEAALPHPLVSAEERLREIAPHPCPHCGTMMKKYSVSTFTFSDGLGFGSPVLHVCFNDACPPFVKAWQIMAERFGRMASQRYYFNPHDQSSGVLPVGNKNAMKGDVIE